MAVHVQSLLCASCGARIDPPGDIDQITCAHCGTALTIVRGDGYIASKLADRVEASIGRNTRQQEIASLELQLTAIEGEGRALRRAPSTRTTRQQLDALELRYNALVDRLHRAQDDLGVPHTHVKFHRPESLTKGEHVPVPVWVYWFVGGAVAFFVLVAFLTA